MPNIYYDPYADALREIAELNAAVAASKGEAQDGELLRAMLKRLVEGGTLSQDDERRLSGLRERYLQAGRLSRRPGGRARRPPRPGSPRSPRLRPG